jgi:hypothetical protein
MPFRKIPPGQFSVDLLKQMQAAYDAICLQLKIDGTTDPRSSNIANIIMDLAAKGERERLAERTLEIATGPGSINLKAPER